MHRYITRQFYLPCEIVLTVVIGNNLFWRWNAAITSPENTLTIKSKREDKKDEKVNGVLHKGIAQREFVRSFALGEDIKVKDAKLEKGLLTVDLEREIPEHKKPRQIEVH